MCINNEFTLLLLAYDNYIDGADDSTRCPGKAYTLKKQIAQHPAISKAGEFSLLLGWLKILDVSNDNPGASIKIIKRLFRKSASFLIEHSDEGIQEIIEDYKPDIENNEPEFEELQHHTGRLAEVMAQKIGNLSSASGKAVQKISQLFYYIGRHVLLVDHLIDIEKDIEETQYNPIITDSIKNSIPIADAYNSMFSRYIQNENKIAESLQQIAYEQDSNIAFINHLVSALNTLKTQILEVRKHIIPDADDVAIYLSVSVSETSDVAVHFCGPLGDICEYDGGCSCESARKACYGDNCYNACCGGDFFGRDSSGCSCCGHSYYGKTCVGYTNCCDCMFGCDGGDGCCFNFSVWKRVLSIGLIALVVYLIFNNFLFVIGAVGVVGALVLLKYLRRR